MYRSKAFHPSTTTRWSRTGTIVIAPGDLLAILSAGAYAMAMSSNYNTRPRPCEVIVDGDRCHEVRARESIASLFALESRLPA